MARTRLEEEERSRRAVEELTDAAAGAEMSSAQSKEWADFDRRTPLGPGQTRKSIHTFGAGGIGYVSAVTNRPTKSPPSPPVDKPAAAEPSAAGATVLEEARKTPPTEGEQDASRLAQLRGWTPPRLKYLRGSVDDRKQRQEIAESRARIEREMVQIQQRQGHRRRDERKIAERDEERRREDEVREKEHQNRMAESRATKEYDRETGNLARQDSAKIARDLKQLEIDLAKDPANMSASDKKNWEIQKEKLEFQKEKLKNELAARKTIANLDRKSQEAMNKLRLLANPTREQKLRLEAWEQASRLVLHYEEQLAGMTRSTQEERAVVEEKLTEEREHLERITNRVRRDAGVAGGEPPAEEGTPPAGEEAEEAPPAGEEAEETPPAVGEEEEERMTEADVRDFWGEGEEEEGATPAAGEEEEGATPAGDVAQPGRMDADTVSRDKSQWPDPVQPTRPGWPAAESRIVSEYDKNRPGWQEAEIGLIKGDIDEIRTAIVRGRMTMKDAAGVEKEYVLDNHPALKQQLMDRINDLRWVIKTYDRGS